MTDSELLDALEKFTQIDRHLAITRTSKSVEIKFTSFGRTAYGWTMREAITNALTVVAELVERKLGADDPRADWPPRHLLGTVS